MWTIPRNKDFPLKEHYLNYAASVLTEPLDSSAKAFSPGLLEVAIDTREKIKKPSPRYRAFPMGSDYPRPRCKE